MNITRAAAPSTQAVSPGLILTRCAAAAASQTVSTRHLRFSDPSDGGRLDERLSDATRSAAGVRWPVGGAGSVRPTKRRKCLIAVRYTARLSRITVAFAIPH